METLNAAELLAALGHESRLTIFRLLVEAGPAGINASGIGEQLGMAPATLSFHLAHLSRVGLIAGERESRFIHYSANYGTMDELFDALCLVQTRKINPIPIILVGKEFWRHAFNVEFLAEEGVIAPEDVAIFQRAETAEEIWEIIRRWYSLK